MFEEVAHFEWIFEWCVDRISNSRVGRAHRSVESQGVMLEKISPRSAGLTELFRSL